MYVYGRLMARERVRERGWKKEWRAECGKKVNHDHDESKRGYLLQSKLSTSHSSYSMGSWSHCDVVAVVVVLLFFHSCRTFHNVARFSAWNQRIIYSYMQSILLIHCVWEWGQIHVARVERKKKTKKKNSMAHANIGLIIYFYIIHCTYDHCVYTKTFRRKQRYSTVHRSVRLFENLWNHHEWWYFFLIKKGNWSCFFFASLFTIFLFCRHFVCCSLILVLRLLLAHLESKRAKGERKNGKNDNISRKRCWKKKSAQNAST